MGITPGVLHLNEGHSGFAVFEAIRDRMEEEGLDFDAGRSAQIPREVVFTTHTPVPAGHDRFDRRPDRRAPRTAARPASASPTNTSWAWAASIPTDHGETFCMTVLGLKLSRRANAVSALHGEVSRAMWTGLYPGKLGRRGPHRPHHQRRPCARRGWRRRCSASTIATWARAGTSTAANRDLGRHRERRRRRAVGDASQPESAAPRLRAPPRRGAGRTPRRIAGNAAAARARSSRPMPSPSALRAASPPTSAPT